MDISQQKEQFSNTYVQAVATVSGCSRHCGYWMALRGVPETPNATTVTVELPRSNRFTVEAVVLMFQHISNGGLP